MCCLSTRAQHFQGSPHDFFLFPLKTFFRREWFRIFLKLLAIARENHVGGNNIEKEANKNIKERVRNNIVNKDFLPI